LIKFAGLLKMEKLVNLKPTVPPEIVEYRDIEYKKIGTRSLKMDIYHSKSLIDSAPILIFIHGGAWKQGNKQDYLVYLIDFAKRGFMTASVAYRFSQEAPFPAAVKDVKCAIKWIKSHSNDYFINSKKVAVIGGSAGGHLALMIAYSTGETYFMGECPADSVRSKVQATVNLYGPVDLTTDFAISKNSVINFLGGNLQQFPELYFKASPKNFISPDDPPTLIFHGTIDKIVPVSQSDSLKKWLDVSGVPNYYHRLSAWPHTTDAVVSVNKYVQHYMTDFFEKYLLH
jgi:acetyl esterase/lipase